MYPTVWSRGGLFAFSGLDGQTVYSQNLTALTLEQKIGLKILPHPDGEGAPAYVYYDVDPEAIDSLADPVCAPDLVDVAVPAGRLRIVATDCRTVLFTAPEAVRLVLNAPGDYRLAQTGAEYTLPLSRASGEYVRVTSRLRNGQREFLIRYETAATPAAPEAWPDGEDMVRRRRAFYGNLPGSDGLYSPAARACLARAYGIMKVNVYAPEGRLEGYWTTPDRWPHRRMWLWDSVFHAMGNQEFDARLAQDTLKSVLALQTPESQVVLSTDCFGPSQTRHTQPPLLAWGVWMVYARTRDRAFLEYCYPRLAAYLDWNRTHRDVDGDGLLEWMVEENSDICRCGESGLDNSSKFDFPGPGISVEFNSLMAHECEYMERAARELGLAEEAGRHQQERARIINAIQNRLWDAEDGFYYDLDVRSNAFRKVKAITGFLPLLTGSVPPERMQTLIDRHLCNPDEFATPLPIATIARCEPTYDDDMWRGPVWLNVNYLVAVGLVKSGREDLALHLAERVCATVERIYRQRGVIYEFYDAEDRKEPPQLARKGYAGIRTIADYHWSAVCYLLFKKRIWRLQGPGCAGGISLTKEGDCP